MRTIKEAEFLQPLSGAPILDVLHTSFDQRGDPFEITRFVHRADKSELVYTFDIEN
ncbi:hypothetical protein GCM10027436_56740 [Actinophytocola sediminis]